MSHCVCAPPASLHSSPLHSSVRWRCGTAPAFPEAYPESRVSSPTETTRVPRLLRSGLRGGRAKKQGREGRSTLFVANRTDARRLRPPVPDRTQKLLPARLEVRVYPLECPGRQPISRIGCFHLVFFISSQCTWLARPTGGPSRLPQPSVLLAIHRRCMWSSPSPKTFAPVARATIHDHPRSSIMRRNGGCSTDGIRG